MELPEERIVLVDPLCDGTAEPIGAEETCQIMWRRGGPVRVVTVRTKYRSAVSPASTAAEETMPVIVTTPVPPQILTRSIATASLLAHIVSDKFCDGLPLYRQEDRFSRLGCRIDRGSMSRWIEDLGMIMGSSLVKAMRDDAFANAFCISTDATGVLVQPLATGDKQRRACRRGHYFVQIADDDHIFFEYTAKETSAAVGEMFKGYSGYIQADAKSVYDFLFRPPQERVPLDDHDVDRAVRHELGCWSHYPEPVIIWSWPSCGKSPGDNGRGCQSATRDNTGVTTTRGNRSTSATGAKSDRTCGRVRSVSRTRRGRLASF